MDLKKFFSELKRRNVYKVALTYAITSWILAQIVALASDTFGAPDWVTKIVFVILIVGFPIALILAWAFEMSPQGIIRTASDTSNENPYSERKKKPLTGNLFIGILLIIILGQFVYSKYYNPNSVNTAKIEKSVAVLPFINDSDNKENLYFCNGIMEGILDHLAKIEDLTVTSRTSVERYRENKPSLRQIAEELGVQYLVEGSVQRIDNEVVIFAQLIYAADDKHLWSKRYNKKLTDVFEVQANVTESIADKLQAIILPDVRERIQAIPTKDVVAYDYYLQGNEFIRKAVRSQMSYDEWEILMQKATLFYEQAIARDSSLAEAYIGLGKIEKRRTLFTNLFEANYMDKVLALANKAISLNPNLYDGYLMRGDVYLKTNQFELAKNDFEKVQELIPNNVFSLSILAEINTEVKNDYIKAIEILKKIESNITDDQLYELYLSYYGFYGLIGDRELQEKYLHKCIAVKPDGFVWTWFYTSGGRLDEALAFLRKRFPVENQYRLADEGMIYSMKHDFETSLDKWEKWEVLVQVETTDGRASINDWHRYGQALMKNGDTEKGMKMIQKQIDLYNHHIELSRIGYVNTYYDLAGIYAFLGDLEKAYYWLDRFEKENGWIKYGTLESFIQYDFQFDNIRNDQRFKDITTRGTKQLDSIRKGVREYLASEEEKNPQGLAKESNSI